MRSSVQLELTGRPHCVLIAIKPTALHRLPRTFPLPFPIPLTKPLPATRLCVPLSSPRSSLASPSPAALFKFRTPVFPWGDVPRRSALLCQRRRGDFPNHVPSRHFPLSLLLSQGGAQVLAHQRQKFNRGVRGRIVRALKDEVAAARQRCSSFKRKESLVVGFDDRVL